MSRYQSNRQTLIEAFKAVIGRLPTRNEAQIIQSVGEHETNWGQGWKEGEGLGSNNVGAVQGSPGFEHIDHHADGSQYTTTFRSYPSLLEGAKDLVRLLTIKRPAAWSRIRAGDYRGAAYAMRASGYFEAPAESYYQAILKAGQKIATDLNEPLASNKTAGVIFAGAGLGAAYAAYRFWFK